MTTFLVEIGTEELPPKILRTLASNFAKNICFELNKSNINYDNIQWFATPRRLAVQITKIKIIQHYNTIKKKNTDIKNTLIINKKSILKNDKDLVLKTKNTINKIKESTITETNNNKQLTYDNTKIQKKKYIQDLFYNITNNAINKLSKYKTMRWGNKNISFIRPVHTVTILLNNNLITGNILGIKIDRIIYGHRFMGEKKITLDHADNYLQKLLNNGRVIADYQQRKNIIQKNIKKLIQKVGGITDIDNDLLEEVTSLVEWPVVFIARFEDKFLTIPTEILICAMKKYQKYFPVYKNNNNKLLPYFIFVTNIESKNSYQIIIENEKVIQARLTDAKFFFNSDCKLRLEERLPYLDKIIFQKKLGSLLEKSNRIKLLSASIAKIIGANIQEAARAGQLSKCDLTSNMVVEFTEIQGIMGMYYALHDGELETIALALKEQYQPRFSGDKLPTTKISCSVSIADKMDTLIGFFAIGQYPKKNKDPFSLRRAAFNILRIIIEKQLPIDLQTLTEETIRLYEKKISNNTNTIINQIINFMLNRLPTWYKEQGYCSSIIQAVLVIRPTKPVDFDCRIKAINHFRTSTKAEFLITANKRISNILNKYKNLSIYKDLKNYLLQDPYEIELAKHMLILQKKLPPLFNSRQYQDVLNELAELYKPIDLFFKNVTVITNNYEIKINRLTLLNQLRNLFLQMADISLLR